MADDRYFGIKVGLSDEELVKGVKETINTLNTMKSEVNKTSAELKAYGKTEETLSASQNALNKIIKEQEKYLGMLAEQHKRTANAQGEDSKQAQALERKINQTSSQLAGYKAKLATVTTELEKFSNGSASSGTKVKNFGSDVASIDNKLKQYKAQLASAENDIKQFGASHTTVKNKMAALENVYAAQKAKLAALENEYKQTAAASGKFGTEAKQLQTKIASLKQSMNGIESELGQTERAMEELAPAARKAGDSMREMAEDTKKIKNLDVANTLKDTGEKFGELGQASLDAAKDNQDATTRIKVQTGATGEEAKKMANAAKQAYTGVYADSASEAADAVAGITKNVGNLNQTDLNNVTNAMLTMERNGSDLDENTRGLAAMMKNFGLSAQEATDLMSAGFQNGLDRSHELGDNMAEYSQLWGQMGFSAKDTFGILQSGLDSGAYNLDKVNDLVKEMGISLNDGRFDKNMDSFSDSTKRAFQAYKDGSGSAKPVIMGMINDLTSMKDKTKAAEIASTMWSALGEDNALKVMEAMKKPSKAYDDTAGSAKKMVKDNSNDFTNLQGSIREMQQAIAPIGESIARVLTPIIDTVSKIAKAFGDLPQPIQDFITAAAAIATVTAILAPLISLMRTLGPLISGIAGLFANPWVLGIAAAIGAVVVVCQNWGNITAWLQEKWTAFKEWISPIWNKIVSVWKSVVGGFKEYWSGVWTALQELWNSVKELFATIFEPVVAAWKKVVSKVSGFFSEQWKKIQKGWEKFKEPFEKLWSSVTNKWKETVNKFKKFFDKVWTPIKEAGSKGVAKVGSTVSAGWNKITAKTKAAWNKIKNVVAAAWSEIKRKINELLGPIIEVVRKGWEKIKNKTSEIWGKVKGVVSTAWNRIKEATKKALGPIVDPVVKAWEKIKNKTSEYFGKVRGKVSDVWSKVKNVIKSVLGPIDDAIGGFKSLWNTVCDVMDKVVGKINRTWASVKHKINKLNPFRSIGPIEEEVHGTLTADGTGEIMPVEPFSAVPMARGLEGVAWDIDTASSETRALWTTATGLETQAKQLEAQEVAKNISQVYNLNNDITINGVADKSMIDEMIGHISEGLAKLQQQNNNLQGVNLL